MIKQQVQPAKVWMREDHRLVVTMEAVDALGLKLRDSDIKKVLHNGVMDRWPHDPEAQKRFGQKVVATGTPLERMKDETGLTYVGVVLW